ncbi:MAG: hypothetical protein A2023_04310 [Sulfuricurvum sp. GWF2_44_89]|uniref:SapC family protein n=1 Tax=Sulfuricurvum kujiense TaxID=148813 RepID=A0A2D3WKI5_9BACT|nr:MULTISPECIES: SapC family protein [Sulfuricurvum]OHD77972.1 MAG: hypothetical protein A2023_04310 [Sulfuricurvum sp. GWF2_44_89]OHD91141.1 MAG: hypothetical protein A2517_10725 [Sulfuricurvum sp. RIFOXYD12_FULL_44_77]OHD93078.1 MAG: hypothetical protein A2552_10825 [Sulfuricurvum sp. RIFOXYD2_FULL_44_160]DAB38234.1 MAG TPA: hypothetical protein CFH83_07000 [Sulfuricurvum kujiense]
MFKNVTPLNKDEHAKLKFDKSNTFEFAKEMAHTLLAVGEYFHACKSQPILFALSGDTIASIALMGLKEGRNLFVDKKSNWYSAEYCPFSLRRYPFIYIETINPEQPLQSTMILGFDSDSKAINTKKGESLFTTENEPSQLTQNIIQTLNVFQADMANTIVFTNKLKELELLEPFNAEMVANQQGYKIEGFLRVNEERFKALPNEIKIELIDNGMYNLIVAHLLSLSNFEKLAVFSI